MARIRGRNTKPELIVRGVVRKLGLHYRLHVPGLPGKPDLVFSPRKKVIFVHGCYWHRHSRCRFAYLPKSNVDFWIKKFAANRNRDRRVQKELARLGWNVLIVWECETADTPALEPKIAGFLANADA